MFGRIGPLYFVRCVDGFWSLLGLRITGTFLDEITYDIPSNNWGEKEWTEDFRIMELIGIDTVIRQGRSDDPDYNKPGRLRLHSVSIFSHGEVIMGQAMQKGMNKKPVCYAVRNGGLFEQYGGAKLCEI